MAPDVDYLAVATMTDGMVGAELANIIEVAAINMLRDGRTEVFHLKNFNGSLSVKFSPSLSVIIILSI